MPLWLSFSIVVAGVVVMLVATSANRKRAKRLIADIERTTAEAAATNRRYREWAEAQARQASGMAPPAVAAPDAEDRLLARIQQQHEALARAVNMNTTPIDLEHATGDEYVTGLPRTTTDLPTTLVNAPGLPFVPVQGVMMPNGIIRTTAPRTVIVGDIVQTDTGLPLGVALESVQAGQHVNVQITGSAQVEVGRGYFTVLHDSGSVTHPLENATPALPEIPLDAIRSFEYRVDRPMVDVTSYDDLAEGRGSQFVAASRRTDDFYLTVAYTPSIDVYGRDVMLAGRRMTILEATVTAPIDDIVTMDLHLRHSDNEPITSMWLATVQSGRNGQAMRDMATAGDRAGRAIADMGQTFANVDVGRWVGDVTFADTMVDRPRRKPRQPKPAPEPTIRPTGRRFDLEDE